MTNTATAPTQLWFANTLVTVKVAHEAGADGISVLESLAPHGDAPPLHVHETEDEVFHVLEGELRLVVGSEELRAGAGDTVVAPKGIPHTYRVESECDARWLVVTRHGDFERFVRAASRYADRPELPEAAAPTPAQIEALTATARAHNIELVGPPLG